MEYSTTKDSRKNRSQQLNQIQIDLKKINKLFISLTYIFEIYSYMQCLGTKIEK